MSLSGVDTPLLTKGISVVCADVVSVEFAGTDPAGMFVKMTPMPQSIWNVFPLPQPPADDSWLIIAAELGSRADAATLWLKYQEHGKLLAAEIGLRVPPTAPHAPPSEPDPPELEPAPELALDPEPELDPELELNSELELDPELALDPDEPPPVDPPELELPPSLPPGPPFVFDDEPHAVTTVHKETMTPRDGFMALPSPRRVQDTRATP
jgi:hypothetical protein